MTSSPATDGGHDIDPSLGPQAVHRALEILSIVVDRGPLSLSDLARSCGLPTSTTMRMLRALEHWGYASRSEDGSYSRGHRFVESQIHVPSHRAEELIDLSAPVLQRLTEATSESSYLAVPGPARTCTFLREVQSTLPIRHVGFDDWAGRTVSTANSVAGEVLEGRTPESGYVVMPAVEDKDATVIGAPVFGADGACIAAVSIAGPSFRMPEDVIAADGKLVRSAAEELTTALAKLVERGQRHDTAIGSNRYTSVTHIT